MKLQIVAVITFTSILCGSLNSSYGQGQWKPWSSPTQKPLRLLGQGWSAGYHWRNPGHDSSYYNPYSAHNSYLLTGSSGYSGGGEMGRAGYAYPFDQDAFEYNAARDRVRLPTMPNFEGETLPGGRLPTGAKSDARENGGRSKPSDQSEDAGRSSKPPVPPQRPSPQRKSVLDELPIDFD